MTAPFTCVLFDLDGTIADSAPAITASISWTLEQLGRPVPSPTELLEWVGPPLLDSFRDRAGMTEIEAAHALSVYRAHHIAKGGRAVEIYSGVPAMLDAVRASGVGLSIATSKPESMARVILESHDLTAYFDHVTGASDDQSRTSKADVVAEALRRLTEGGRDISNPVMVGDRHHDVVGAAANGVPTILVEWGYGSPAEQVGTIAVAADAPALQKLLLAA